MQVLEEKISLLMLTEVFIDISFYIRYCINLTALQK